MHRILDMIHLPEQNESGFVYLTRDIEQLFASEGMNRDIEALLFANENSIHFPLPESGPLIEKVILLS